MKKNTISIAVTGSGGSGAVTTGLMLLDAMARAGFRGFMSRSAGPQIRGGESAVMLRFSNHSIFSPDDVFNVLLALDWNRIERFADEIPLGAQSLIIGDSGAGEVPAILTETGARVVTFDLVDQAKATEGGRANMIGLGILTRLLDLSEQAMFAAVEATLGKKGQSVVDASRNCVKMGLAQEIGDRSSIPTLEKAEQGPLWNISGNEAAGLGALRGGVRFVAAYPITPASEILEWFAPRLEKVGGSLLQAEDELASINMIIGGSFGGVPSLTATSGPGLSLMMEALGLAVASETPIVVVNVQRGGPSTGIPTKSEQADLNLAIYGFHGDAPHLVLAPLNIQDCIFTTHWAVSLSEQMQTVAIVLSDQSLGQSRVIMSPPDYGELNSERKAVTEIEGDYERYQLTDDGISPMAIPGTPNGMYTADGLEHTEHGTPSSMSIDHLSQMAKRQRKITEHDYGDHWAKVEGDGDLVLISWGSASGVCFEAAERLRAQGYATKSIALRLIMPLNHDGLKQAIGDAQQIAVVEQNQDGQLFRYLRSEGVLPPQAFSISQPGPLPIRPAIVIDAFTREMNMEQSA